MMWADFSHSTRRRWHGFTILELIIVIFVIAVLTSLAVPRLFSLIALSRVTEANINLGVIRRSVLRCVEYSTQLQDCLDFDGMDIEDPGNSPNAHFDYLVGFNNNRIIIRATRNTVDADAGTGSFIQLEYRVFQKEWVRNATGIYTKIK